MGIRVPQESKDAFAAKLKAWRQRHGITQAQAAQFLKMPLRTLQNWEIARTKPSAMLASGLVALMNLDLKDRPKKRRPASA